MKIKVIFNKSNNRVIITECEGIITMPNNYELVELEESEFEGRTYYDAEGNVYVKGDVQ